MRTKPELGDKIVDSVTGFIGIIVAEMIWLNGCVRYAIQGPTKDGEIKDPVWIDSQQINIMEENAVPSFRTKKTEDEEEVRSEIEKKEKKETGGPTPIPKRFPVPKR